MRFLLIFFILSTLLLSQGRDPIKQDSIKTDTTSLRRPPGRVPLAKDSVIVDTLLPAYQVPLQGALYEYGFMEITTLNYRNNAGLFSHFPVTYNRSMGFLGLPSELSIYGEGLGKISFLEDGIEVNNRYTNSLHFDYLQDGYIEKLSLYPSYMGFLYSTTPNQMTIAISGRDFVSGAPYSRMKYFEGPGGEGYIDVQFNQTIKDRLIFFTEISNNKVDDGYRNSDLSLWKGKINLKYLLSNFVNLSAGYNYTEQKLGLNGGVNYDSAKTLASLITGRTLDDIIYDDRAAPVNFLNRYQKNSLHRLHFKAFGSFAGKGYFETVLYHQKNLNEFRQNEDSAITNLNRSLIDRKSSVTGGSFRTTFDTEYFAADIHANYESINLESFQLTSDLPTTQYTSLGETKKNTFSTGGVLTGKLGGFSVSGFGKVFLYDGSFYPGIGGEAKAIFSDKISFRAGFSYLEGFESDLGYINATTKTSRFESEVKFVEDNFSVSVLGWFANTDRKSDGILTVMVINPLIPYPIIEHENVAFGAVGQFIYSIGAFQTFVNLQFNNKKLKNFDKNILPQLNTKFGLTYSDILFDSALNLKTTISYSFRTRTIATNYNFFVDRVFYLPYADDVPASGQLDFFVAGTIQKAATVYFAWENLLGSKYYLSPYYPVLSRNIRFGIAWEFLN
jgi:hypothetical protein